MAWWFMTRSFDGGFPPAENHRMIGGKWIWPPGDVIGVGLLMGENVTLRLRPASRPFSGRLQ